MTSGKSSKEIAEEILEHLYEESGNPQNSKDVEYTREHFYQVKGNFPAEDVRKAEQYLKEKGHLIFNKEKPDSVFAKARLFEGIRTAFAGIAEKDDERRYIKSLVEEK